MSSFRAGDRVIVPWGLSEIEGTVVDSFGPASEPIVTVRIVLGDDDYPGDDIGFPASALRLAEPAGR